MDSWSGRTLAVLGGVAFLYTAYCIVDFLTLHFLTDSRPLEAFQREESVRPWALVTGASAGIGFATALELARNGFDVIILGHRGQELAEAKKQLESSVSNVTVRVIVMDAQFATADDMVQAVRSIEALPVTILVNNVGGLYIDGPVMRELQTYSLEEVDTVLNLNARFMARLTTLMLPILSRKPTRPGQQSLIINTSSASNLGLPWVIMYSASKSFVRAFSHSLARELDNAADTRHIKSVCLIPGDVISQSNRVGIASSCPTSDDYGKWAVQAVGGAVKRGMRDFTPYWKHDLQVRSLAWLNERIVTTAVVAVMREKVEAWRNHAQKSQ